MMDYSLFFKTSEQISTKYGTGIFVRPYNVHFKGNSHPNIFFFFKFSQNITRTVHYRKRVTARSTVHLRYQPEANLVNDFSITYETRRSIIAYTKHTTAHYPTPLTYSRNYDTPSL